MSSPLGITEPTQGGDTDTWGTKLNTALTALLNRLNGHHLQHEHGGFDEVSLDAAQVASGVLAIGRLATGTPDGTKFVRDDGTLVTPAGGGAPFPTNYLAPTGAGWETVPRQNVGSTPTALTSGTLYLVGIQLPVGFSVGHLAWYTTQSVFTTTHWWFSLHDSSRVMLAVTADQTTTAWTSGTIKSLAVATVASGAASSFTTTYTGLHYLGIMVAAPSGQTPAIDGVPGPGGLYGLAPALCGTSNSSQTTPPAFPFTASALSALSTIPYGYVAA